MKEFMANGNFVCPFNDIRKTRETMECEWVLMMSQLPTHSLYHCIMVAAFDTDTLQDLFISKHALPVTKAIEYTLKGMMDWGDQFDREWYSKTISMLWNLGWDDEEFNSKKQVFAFAIQDKIFEEIHTYFAWNTLTAATLFCDWHDTFHKGTLWVEDGGDFPNLVMSNIQWIKHKVNQVRLRGVINVYPDIDIDRLP